MSYLLMMTLLTSLVFLTMMMMSSRLQFPWKWKTYCRFHYLPYFVCCLLSEAMLSDLKIECTMDFVAYLTSIHYGRCCWIPTFHDANSNMHQQPVQKSKRWMQLTVNTSIQQSTHLVFGQFVAGGTCFKFRELELLTRCLWCFNELVGVTWTSDEYDFEVELL